MASKALVYVVAMWSMFMNLGVRGARFSRNEDLELDRELKLLKKPSVKTIKTKYGDLYDCMDFYKQPAFDHPLLKNHNFHPEMRPSITPQWRTKPTAFPTQAHSMKLKDGGCPNGTVPIRRVTKDYLIQMKQLSKQYTSSSKTNGVIKPQPGTIVSVVQSKDKPQGMVEYRGIGGSISVYNVQVDPDQYSSSELMLQNGNDSIRVGLMAGNSHCFNTLCSGFVSLRQDIPIDGVVGPVSERGRKLYAYKFFIFQDPRNGNWWLEVEKLGIVIGFWPSSIFSRLSSSASYIAVGGEAYSPPSPSFSLPLMGSGYLPTCSKNDVGVSGFCIGFVAVDANYDVVDPKNTEVYSNDVEWYEAVDAGLTTSWGRLVCFGGPFW